MNPEQTPKLGAMESSSPEISVDELRTAVGRLLDAVEGLFGQSVQLGVDSYDGLFSPKIFPTDGSAPEIMGRSLSDDVASVRQIAERADRSEDENLLWHDLNHLVGILQRVSALAS